MSTLNKIRLVGLPMKKTDAIKYFGSSAKLARFLKIDRTAVYQWGEFIPENRQYELEVKTGGILKSDYSLQQEKNNEKNYKKCKKRRVSAAR